VANYELVLLSSSPFGGGDMDLPTAKKQITEYVVVAATHEVNGVRLISVKIFCVKTSTYRLPELENIRTTE